MDEEPTFSSSLRLKGTRADGIAFQRRVAREVEKGSTQVGLPGPLSVGPWFEFEDEGGYGIAQPDLVLDVGPGLLIIECKRTWTPIARSQLLQKYSPILRAAYDRPTFCLAAIKIATPDTPQPIALSLADGVKQALQVDLAVWHHIWF